MAAATDMSFGFDQSPLEDERGEVTGWEDKVTD
jgi:hypothetical protein